MRFSRLAPCIQPKLDRTTYLRSAYCITSSVQPSRTGRARAKSSAAAVSASQVHASASSAAPSSATLARLLRKPHAYRETPCLGIPLYPPVIVRRAGAACPSRQCSAAAGARSPRSGSPSCARHPRTAPASRLSSARRVSGQVDEAVRLAPAAASAALAPGAAECSLRGCKRDLREGDVRCQRAASGE